MSAALGQETAPSAARSEAAELEKGGAAEYQAFISSLFSRLEKKLATEADPEVQAQIAHLVRLATIMPRRAVEEHRELFELACALLVADRPKLLVSRSLAADLLEIHEQHAGGMSRLLLVVCGNTRLNAILSALLTIVVLSFVVMTVMGGTVRLLRAAMVDSTGSSGVVDTLRGVPFTQLLLTVHAAFLGSVVSIVVRINSFLTRFTVTPLVTYISIVTRPVVSVLVSILVFTTLKSGLIELHGLDFNTPNSFYLAWAVGFLCGFSERFAQDFVVNASGTLTPSGAAEATPRSTGDRN